MTDTEPDAPITAAGGGSSRRRGGGRALRSVTFRLGLAYFALFSLSVLGLLGFLYWSTAGYLSRQTDAVIEAEIQGLAERYRRDGLRGLTALVAERLARNPASPSVYVLADRGFTVLVGNLAGWPAAPEDEDGWVEFRLVEGDERDVHRARARHFELRGGIHLLVGRNVKDLDEMRRAIGRAALWVALLTGLLALGGAVVTSRYLAHRIDIINRTSRRIMAGELSERIPNQESGDEFDQLAESLNAMLDRIQVLMEDVRRVSDNVAHDLRTPLARLHGRLQQLRESAGDAALSRELVEGALVDAEHLLHTFNALLRIARVETSQRRRGFRPVSLSRVVEDVIDLYAPLAEERHLRLETALAEVPAIAGDRDLLFQAIANVLDNAIKYTPDDGRITVGLAVTDARVALTVADDGPGVPPEARRKVLERFFRLDDSRTTPGTGLGLSLVAAVARLHEATLVLGDNEPGLRVTLGFPVALAREDTWEPVGH